MGFLFKPIINYFLNMYCSRNLLHIVFFSLGISFARRTLGKVTVFIKIAFGICDIQHHKLQFTSGRIYHDYCCSATTE